jgi:MFS family permease
MTTDDLGTDAVRTSQKRPLAALVTANYLSWIGNTMTLVAVPLYVLQTSGSAVQAGAAGFANSLPMVIAGMVGGVVTDRIGARRTSVAADLVAGVCMAAVPLLHSSIGIPAAVLLALLFLRSLADAPGSTARLTLLPQAIERAGVRPEAANSLFHSGQRVALIAGPPAAALLAGVTGPAAVLYFDAATFALSALLIALAVAKPQPAPGGPGERGSMLRDLREGGRFILRTPLLIAILSVVVVTNFVDDAFTPVLLPVYSRQVLQDSGMVGWLLAANGVGAVTGALVYGPASRRLLANRYTTFVGCFGLVAFARVVMVGLPGLWTVLLLSFLIGVASGPLNPLITTLVQRVTPAELLGRVFGAVMATAFAAAPLGILLSGWLVQTAGLRWALGSFAALYVLLIVYAVTNRPLRGLSETSAPGDPEAVRA